jgi:hypothetical protein
MSYFKCVVLIVLVFFMEAKLVIAQSAEGLPRVVTNLAGSDWQFYGVPDGGTLPEIGSSAYEQGPWTTVSVPHDFQTRAAYKTIVKGWYRRKLEIDPSLKGKELYLVLEGAATVADVWVNDSTN